MPLPSPPAVSVIVPAYRAGDTIGAALGSVVSAGLARDDVEVVVASDDGIDYAGFAPSGLTCVFVPPGPVGTGPSLARNRAMDVARGDYLAFLDADDLFAPAYLSTLLPLARGAGASAGRSLFRLSGRDFLRLPRGDTLSFGDIADSGASFHVLVRREMAGRFRDILSEDILHLVETMALCGGTLPIGGTDYIVNLTAGSVTDQAGVSGRLDRDYRRIIDWISAGDTRVPPDLRTGAAGIFAAKIGLNAAFAAQSRFATYYEFVADRLS